MSSISGVSTKSQILCSLHSCLIFIAVQERQYNFPLILGEVKQSSASHIVYLRALLKVAFVWFRSFGSFPSLAGGSGTAPIHLETECWRLRWELPAWEGWEVLQQSWSRLWEVKEARRHGIFGKWPVILCGQKVVLRDPLESDMGAGKSGKEEVRQRTNNAASVCLQRALCLLWHPSCARKTAVLGVLFVLC